MSMPALDMNGTTVVIDSDLLGPLSVESDQLMHFPEGLLGFPENREFVLVPAQRPGTYWLQATRHASLAFLVIDPFVHFPDYVVELTEPEVRDLEATDQADVAILAIVTLPATEGDPATANLQGPLAFNLSRGIARQVVLRDTDAGVRRSFHLEVEPGQD